MSLTVVVGGVDISARVDVGSLQITQVLTRRGDTASVTVYDTLGTFSASGMATITITDELGNMKFGGLVTKRTRTTPSAGVTGWQLDGQDYTYYLQHTLANKKYSGTTIDVIVKDLLSSFPPQHSFGTTGVQSGLPSLTQFNVAHLTEADAFDKLVRMASSTTFLMWDVDPNGNLFFYDANHAPAADVILTDAVPTINPPSQSSSVARDFAANSAGPGTGYANYERDSFQFVEDYTQLANSVTLRGGTQLSVAYTQTWVGNASQTSFPFDYPPDTTTAGASMPTVTVGGVGQTVALDTGAGFGANQALIGYAKDTGAASLLFAAAPASAAVIQATYYFDVPVLVRYRDNGSVTSYGVWEIYVVDTTLVTLQAAVQRAQGMLSQYSQPLQTAQCYVDVAYRGKLAAGQQVQLVNTQIGLNLPMICTDCAIVGMPGGNYQHQLKLAAI